MINQYVIAHGEAAVAKYTALPKAGPSDLDILRVQHKFVRNPEDEVTQLSGILVVQSPRPLMA